MLRAKLGRNSLAIELSDLKPFLALFAALGWWVLPPVPRRNWHPLGLSLTVVAAVEMTAFLLSCYGQYNLWLYNLSIAAEVPLGVWVLWSIVDAGRLRATAFWATLVPAAVMVWELFSVDPKVEMLGHTWVTNGVVLLVLFTWALFYMALEELTPLARSPRFWVAFAFVLFYGCTLPITGLFSSLTIRNPVLADRLYILNDVPYALYYLLLCWVFFRLLRRPTPDMA